MYIIVTGFDKASFDTHNCLSYRFGYILGHLSALRMYVSSLLCKYPGNQLYVLFIGANLIEPILGGSEGQRTSVYDRNIRIYMCC